MSHRFLYTVCALSAMRLALSAIRVSGVWSEVCSASGSLSDFSSSFSLWCGNRSRFRRRYGSPERFLALLRRKLRFWLAYRPAIVLSRFSVAVIYTFLFVYPPSCLLPLSSFLSFSFVLASDWWISNRHPIWFLHFGFFHHI